MEAALGAFEARVDTGDLARRLRVSRSTRVTPLMFEYDLIDRARSTAAGIVLPEGTEERILRAAEILLRRGVADLTLLGDRPRSPGGPANWASTSAARTSSTRPRVRGGTSSPPRTRGCAPTRASPLELAHDIGGASRTTSAR